MKTLDRIKNHPKVDSISDERRNGDGLFVYLVKGYCRQDMDNGNHHVFGESVTEAYRKLSRIAKCECERCQEAS